MTTGSAFSAHQEAANEVLMPKAIDLTGKTFGRLTVIAISKRSRRAAWDCQCVCGNSVVVAGPELRRGETKSCGCLRREITMIRGKRNVKHGQAKTGRLANAPSLLSAFPKSVPRADLDDATGYKRSSRDAYIARMKAKRLVVIDGSAVRASEDLF